MTTLTAPLVGMRHHPGAAEALSDLGFGDPLTLVREPENQFDENAIQVFSGSTLLGYVKREFAADWAPAFDEDGVIPQAKLGFESSGWPQVQIEFGDELVVVEVPEAAEEPESDAIPEGERGEV